MSKFLTIGRHEFTEFQLELLKERGLTEEVARIETINNIFDVIAKAKELGVKDIVIQALPASLLFQLWQLATKEGIALWMFEMDYGGARLISDPAEARENEVLIPAREGGYRAIPVKRLAKIRKIVFEIQLE